MRIVIVSAESMAEGYAPATHIHGLADGLREEGHEVTIVGEDSGSYHSSGLLTRILRYIKVTLSALRLLGSNDVILARGHFAHLPWTIVARLRGVPVVHEMNGKLFDAATTYSWLKPIQWLITWCYLVQFKMSAGIACTTTEIADHIKTYNVQVPVAVVGNGVDPQLFFADDTQRREPFAVFPSSLAAWHGVLTLLDAVRHPIWPPKLGLVIVGDGVLSEAVVERSAGDPRIQYLGRLDRGPLAALLRRAAIGLCLIEAPQQRSVSEVYPLKLFEMMASSLPIIVTDMPGQRDIVLKTNAGLVVPPQDAAALASAAAQLFRDPNREAMGRSGATYVSQQHSWRMRSRELLPFLEDAIRARKPDQP